MQITGDGVWGEPVDRPECVRTVRRAVELGVDLIDTADSYGPEVSESIIHEALHPYPEGLVIATKAGLTRQGPGQWLPVGRPEYLRQQCEMSLRTPRRGDHRPVPVAPHRRQGARRRAVRSAVDLIDEGKVRSVGLSQVSVKEIKAALAVVPVVSVQNLYNLTDRSSEDVLDFCEAEGIGFIPWFPIAAGALANPGGPVDAVVKETGTTPSQVALAWLLHRSPVMLPIPGTKSQGHVEENGRAGILELTDDQLASLGAAAA